MIKIIGGKYKKTILKVPKNLVRPTSAIKREAIFSIIESNALKKSFDLYSKKLIIDFFSGSGAVGLEAISRGMAKAVFYENNYKVLNILKENCLKICNKNQFKIINEDIMNCSMQRENLETSIIFIDPPYRKINISYLLNKILYCNLVYRNTLIVVEQHIEDSLDIPKKYNIFKEKSYGNTSLIFLKLR